MDQASLYDDDIVTWSEQQAAALRALAARPELSNAVDWENVAEEIESVGRSQVHAVEKLLAHCIAHMLKRLSAPSALATDHWRAEATTFQAAALNTFERSMRQRLRWDRIWRLARAQASGGLLVHGDELLPGLPEACPLGPEDLLTEIFDMDAATLTLARAIQRKRGGTNEPPDRRITTRLDT